jgi:hypothetical protein
LVSNPRHAIPYLGVISRLKNLLTASIIIYTNFYALKHSK